MKKGSKENPLVPEVLDGALPLKGKDLGTFNKVKGILLEQKKLKMLESLEKRLIAAGKKRAGAELERFIVENSSILEAMVALEARQVIETTTADAIQAGEKGVQLVVREKGVEEEEVRRASDAAAELVQATALLAKQAGPNGKSPLPTYRESKGKEVRKIKGSERLADARWFGEEVEKLGQKWADPRIPRDKIVATGLLKMKALVTQGIKELEDVKANAMSEAELRGKRENLSELLRVMAFRTEGLLNLENQTAPDQQKAAGTEQQSATGNSSPEEEAQEARDKAVGEEIEKVASEYHKALGELRGKAENIHETMRGYFGGSDEDIDKDSLREYSDQKWPQFVARLSDLPDNLSELNAIANPYARLQEARKFLSMVGQMELEADEMLDFLEKKPFLKSTTGQEGVAAPEQSADVNEEEIREQVLAIPEVERHNLWRGITGMGFAVQEFKGRTIAKAVRFARKAGLKDKDSQRFIDRFLDSAAETFEKTENDAKKKREDLYKEGGLVRGAVGIGTGIGNIAMWSRMLLGYGFPPATWVMRGAMAVGKSAEILKNARFKSRELIDSTRMEEDAAYEEAMAIYEKAQIETGQNGVVSAMDLQKSYRERLPAQALKLLEKEGPRGIAQKIAQKHMLWSVKKIATKIRHIENNGISSRQERERDKEKLLRKQESLLADLDHFITRSGMVDMVAYAGHLTQVYGKKISTIMALETLAEGVIHLANISGDVHVDRIPASQNSVEQPDLSHPNAQPVSPAERIKWPTTRFPGHSHVEVESTPGSVLESNSHAPGPLEQIYKGGLEDSEWSGSGIIEIHQGGNTWNAIKDYLQENKLVEGLSQGQKNYVIASIEKRVSEMSDADFAKTGFSSRDIGLVYENQKIDLSQILGNKSEMDAILERAGHLGAATPPEGVAVAEEVPQVSEVENALPAEQADVLHGPENPDIADSAHSASLEEASGGVDPEVPQDPAMRLWEMRHPGEAAPRSFLSKSLELRAHGVPLENNPLFAEEALSRVDSHMKEIFGNAGIKSSQWNSWKDYSASATLRMPQSEYAGPPTMKIQDYLKALIEKTGLEPITRGGREETLEHFIIRAEAGSLSMDLGEGSLINLDSAPGLYEKIDYNYVPDAEYLPDAETPDYSDQEPVQDMPPRYRPVAYPNRGYVPEHRPPHFSNYNYGNRLHIGSRYGYGHGHGHGRSPILRNLLPPFKQWWNPFSGHK